MEAEVLIIGGGVMGLAAAHALALRGARPVVLDALPRATERNASNDVSKVFRLAYGDRDDLALFAQRSLGGWRALERATKGPLLLPHGLLLLARGGPSFAAATRACFARLGLRCEVAEGAAIGARWPAWAKAGFAEAVLDPLGGLLRPGAVLRAFEEQALARGARVLRGPRAETLEARGSSWVAHTTEGEVRAPRAIVAAGVRAPLLLPELAPLLRTSRQPEMLFAPSAPGAFEAPGFPVFAAFEDGYYGFPLHEGAVKVADHRKGPLEGPEPSYAPVDRAEEDGVRAWLRRALPPLAEAPLAASRVCHYDNTPDDDPLLGPHPARPGLALAVGFSGHGFKFAPAVGEALAAWALGEETAVPSAWSPARHLP